MFLSSRFSLSTQFGATEFDNRTFKGESCFNRSLVSHLRHVTVKLRNLKWREDCPFHSDFKGKKRTLFVHTCHRQRWRFPCSKDEEEQALTDMNNRSLAAAIALLQDATARGLLIRMRAWSSRNFMTSQNYKQSEHALTFLVFPSVKFPENWYTSWYGCLLHNICFWQNFIVGFLFFNKNMKLHNF